MKKWFIIFSLILSSCKFGASENNLPLLKIIFARMNIVATIATDTSTTYTIGGTISGYTGSGLVLSEGTESLTITTNATTFTFTTKRASGYSFTVSVGTQPSSQTCTVTGGTGSVASANVTNVSVACVSNTTCTGSGTFSVIGNLQAARPQGSPAAGVYLSNNKIFISGGYNGSTVLSSAEIISVSTSSATSSFTSSPMSSQRAGHTATLLNTGNVLIVGGQTTVSGLGITSSELYSPTTGNFSATGNLNTRRRCHTATLLKNGKVLITGGGDNLASSAVNTAELYDPSSGTFSYTGNMGIARLCHNATLLDNGNVLISGGILTSGGSTSTVEVYDTINGTFSNTGSMSIARMGMGTVKLTDGKVLVAGNYSNGSISYLSSAEIYDPSSNSFTLTGSMMEAKAISNTVVLLDNNKILVAGGYNGSYLSTAEIYDPSTAKFSYTSSMSNTRGTNALALNIGNCRAIVLFGDGSNTTNIELYSY